MLYQSSNVDWRCRRRTCARRCSSGCSRRSNESMYGHAYRCSAPRGGHAMQQTRSLEGPCQVAVTMKVLLTFGASSWGRTRLDQTPGGSPTACHDTTPHHVTFVEVEPGVRLEVLDWGGADTLQTMVLLTGLGDNAHVYDQFAFQFTDDFRFSRNCRDGPHGIVLKSDG